MLNTPPDVVGFRVNGRVDEGDVRTVTRALDEALARHDAVSMLADLREFDDLTVRGLLADLQAGMERLGRLPQLERVAVVSGPGWMQKAADVEDRVFPGVNIRGFDPGEAALARSWVAEGGDSAV